MTILIVLAVITGLLLWYALKGRSWLKSKPWAAGFFAWIEPFEIFLFKKSETILFARIKILTGLLLTVLTQIGEIDLSPFMPFVPEAYQHYVNAAVNALPLIISVMGWADERLRNTTTKPIELVAVPDKVVAASEKLTVAVENADAAKAVAVQAVVAEAKAA